MGLFKEALAPTEPQSGGGIKEAIKAKIVVGKGHVTTHRQSSFMARLLRDEAEIVRESEAAANMKVFVDLPQTLIDQRRINNQNSQGRKKKHKKRKTIITQPTVSPFSFSGISIHHVKPGSYAAVCEEKRLQQLETFGKQKKRTKNDYVDERVFSINNLNKVVKALKAQYNVDNVRQESSGLLTPRPRENSLIGGVVNDPATNSTPEEDSQPPLPSPIKKKHASQEEEAKTKLKFRNKIEQYIAEGQASNRKRQQEKLRPKSASSSVTKTSMEEFDKQSKTTEVQSFFNNYADVDKKKGRPSTSSSNRYMASDKSLASGSLALSSKNKGWQRERERERHDNNNSPYIDDISTEPHLVRGKMFIDHGDRDQRRFGNIRFSDQVFNTRPRSGHFPSKHDTLKGNSQYELWDSKRNQALQSQYQHQQQQHYHHSNRVPTVYTYHKSPQSQLQSPIRNKSTK